MLMALLTMGVLYFVTAQLEALSLYQREAQQLEGGSSSLEQAREALLGHAARYRDTHPDGSNKYVEVFGYLPCPDLNGDGEADPCGTADEASIGLLPYKTLGLPDLRDSSGGCLWYAVSGTFKNDPKATASVMNWDTQGQFMIKDGSGTILAAPDDPKDGAAAVIFAAGPTLGQERSAGATEPCRINPGQIDAYLDGYYESNAVTAYTAAFAANPTGTISLTQGPAFDTTTTPPALINNDRLAWITPRQIFDRVVKRRDFSNPLAATPSGQLNKLTDQIKLAWENQIQADLMAGTTTTSQPVIAGFTQFPEPPNTPGKQIGSLPGTLTLSDNDYRFYYANWSEQYRLALCTTLTTPCLTVAGKSCRGALMFGGRNASGQPRTTAQKAFTTDNLSHYFEPGSGLEILNSPGSTFSGLTAYADDRTAAGRALDIGTCLFPGEFKSFAQDIADFATGVTNLGATPSASVNVASQTARLGNTGAGAGSGCVWYPTSLDLSSSLRLYFRLQFTTKGDGFTLALADGATNQAPNDLARTQIMCGASGSTRLGYAGSPSGAAPGIQKPKIGIEFDTAYSATRNDPLGDHLAFLYWGTTTDTDGADDNTHYLGGGGVAITATNWATGTATATTRSPHGLTVGQVVLVSGLVPAAYNGTVAIAAIPSTTQFSYALTNDPGVFTSPGQAKAISTGSAPRNPRVATAMLNATPVNIVPYDTDAFGGTTRTTSYSTTNQRVSIVTSTAHGLSAGDQVTVSGVTPANYNGTFTVLSSGLTTTRPYRFRYTMTSNPGAYVSGGTAARAKGTEVSALTWAGATASITTPAAHGLSNGQNITTYGMTLGNPPGSFGATANLSLTDATHFTFPLATDPVGSFSTEAPAGMAMVNTGSPLPYTAFPTSTNIYVRLDINRRYDNINHLAVLNMKAYITNSSPSGCTVADFRDLTLDLSTLCPTLPVSLQQDSVPVNALATINSANWSSVSQRVTVNTVAAHGLANGARVKISGASPVTYNGSLTITTTGPNSFTYIAPTDPGTYVSGGDIEPLSSVFFGFTNARGSTSSAENQAITIYDLLMRSQ